MIRLENIVKTYPDKTLFDGATLSLTRQMRVGLVGANGSGKTTLLQLINGLDTPDSGNVVQEKNIRLGYLPQELVEMTNRSILDETILAFPRIVEIEGEIEKLNDQITSSSTPDLLKKLGNLQHQYEELEGWRVRDRAKKILSGLGFKPHQVTQSVHTLSGGWKMRVALAKILLVEPDVLCLDEPTNHLDLDATIWLENFLNEWKGALVLISHDRYFLNKIVNHIVDIHHRKLFLFPGDHEHFLGERVLLREQQAASYKNQQKKIKETETFIDRFRYKNTKSTQVQSRIKMLDKMEKIDTPEHLAKGMSLNIPQPTRAPNEIVVLKKASKYYDETKVYESLDLTILRNQKICLVGPNGAGKSTLIKIIAGVEDLTSGLLKIGTGVDINYFAQHQLEMLDPKKTIYETIFATATDWTMTQIRSYLGGFLFSGDTVDKPVSVLSGGEKVRLALAKMMVHPAHLLLLDEPTNHLDMESRNQVEDTLKNYDGTLLLISHDRHLLNTVSNMTLEITAGGIKEYAGNYDYYLWKKSQDLEPSMENKQENTSINQEKEQRKFDYKEKKQFTNRLNKIEKIMHNLEVELELKTALEANPPNSSDYIEIQKVIEEKDLLEHQILELLEEQESLLKNLSKE
jgi:ATP-binding cassette, subfamily F, member 3